MKRVLSFFLVLSMCISLNSVVVFATETPFTDINSSNYYYNAILWAVEKGITSGRTTTTFAPEESCTRAQVVTFLYRYAGNPTLHDQSNPFKDVNSSNYYYNAVLWAVEKGITSGRTATTFAPNEPCTREQVVTFLYRYAGNPTLSSQSNPFKDVNSSNYYYNAVLWAAEKGITSGRTATTFAPNESCTRGQVAAFLYRYANSQDFENTASTIIVNSVKALAGDKEVVIPVIIENNPGILGMILAVEYDEDIMTLTDASNGIALSALNLTKAKELKSGCNLVWDGREIVESSVIDGTILYLTFDISDTAPKGTYNISLIDKEIIDNNLKPLDITIKSGKIVIE